jgi:hypothetical protein
MEVRVGELIKESSKWIAAVAAGVGIIAPFYVDQRQHLEGIERRLILAEERLATATLRYDGHHADRIRDLTFDSDGFVAGPIRSGIENTIRKFSADNFESKEDAARRDRERWNRFYEANPSIKRSPGQ